MRILFFTPSFYPCIGGVEKHVFEVASKLIKKGHQVLIITENRKDCNIKINPIYQSQAEGDNDPPKIKKADKSSLFVDKKKFFEHIRLNQIDIYYFNFGKKNWFRKFRIWLNILKNRKLIENVDIIHCHDVFFWYLPFRFLYPSKPIFVTFHGYETQFPVAKIAIFIRKLSEKLSLGNICVGDFIKKWYGTKPNFVVYGGVDGKEIQNSKFKVQNYKSKIKKLKILFIGRLEEDTGVSIYLETLEILKERGIRFNFEACGDGRFRNRAEKYGKVHGFVEDASLYLRRADVVFASSYLSIIEAIAAKRSVFAVYDNPLKRDYLGMTPFSKWINIENNAEKLFEKMLYYIEHQNKTNKDIEIAHNWVQKQTWDNVADIYLKLWGNYS